LMSRGLRRSPLASTNGSVQEQTGIPVKLVGQGEGIDDLTGFTPHVFVRQLLE
ncbi:MAG: hypothetical protein ACOYNK_05945, partial [Microbacteriaceae bacterium]